jgi:hypothetical protein
MLEEEDKHRFHSCLSDHSGRLYGPVSIVVHSFGGRGSPTIDLPVICRFGGSATDKVTKSSLLFIFGFFFGRRDMFRLPKNLNGPRTY